MAEDKIGLNDELDFGSIESIINVLQTALELPNTPIQPIEPPLLTVGAKLRPGLSAKKIVSRIISRQSEAGLPVGNIFADGPNTSEAMLVIIIEEIVNSLLTEAKIEITIPPVAPGVPGIPGDGIIR